jgi:hypothetical protein
MVIARPATRNETNFKTEESLKKRKKLKRAKKTRFISLVGPVTDMRKYGLRTIEALAHETALSEIVENT